MLRPTERLFLEQERVQDALTGDDLAYFRLESVTTTGEYSDDDPVGQSIQQALSYQTIPGRVVWGERDRRISVPGGAQYSYVRSSVSIEAVPAIYRPSLLPGRILLVPEPTEMGVVEHSCRLLEIARDPHTGTLTLYCMLPNPSQD